MAHLEIEVVGGLVEQEQVRTAVDDQRQRETRFLAARERSDRRVGHIAAKIEAAEEVPQVLLARLRRGRSEMRERRGLLIQLLELVLREIPDREALPRGAFPRDRIELTGQYPDQRRFAGAVRPEKADTGARPQAELHIFKHDALAVAGRNLRQRDQGIRRALGSAELEVEGHVHVRRGNALQPVQRLETALRLPRLRGLGAEARDES